MEIIIVLFLCAVASAVGFIRGKSKVGWGFGLLTLIWLLLLVAALSGRSA